MSYAPKRPPKERTLDREKVAWGLRVKGWSQEKISDALGVSQAAVSKMLARSTRKYSDAFLTDIKNIKDEQVAQLEQIAAQAMEGWQGSRGDSDGDPRFLHAFMQAKEHIRKIVGADSPVITKNMNFDIDITQLSDEQLNDVIIGKAFK